MAIYRNIQMTFWTDRKVDEDFTPEDKYFYLYLFTNPHTNLAGCYELGIKQASNETGYSKETIERLIDRFIKVHKVIDYCKETSEILLINWHKYNWSKSNDFITGLTKQINNVKNNEFRSYLTNLLDGVETVYRQSIDGGGTTDTVTVTVTDTVIEVPNQKYKYGEYKNVVLTDAQMSKLMEEYPTDYMDRINTVDLYCQSTGKKYKDYLATIRNWARKDKKVNKEQKPIYDDSHNPKVDLSVLEDLYG